MADGKAEKGKRAYAMKRARARVEKLDPAIVKKCGKKRLLRDLQEKYLRDLRSEGYPHSPAHGLH